MYTCIYWNNVVKQGPLRYLQVGTCLRERGARGNQVAHAEVPPRKGGGAEQPEQSLSHAWPRKGPDTPQPRKTRGTTATKSVLHQKKVRGSRGADMTRKRKGETKKKWAEEREERTRGARNKRRT